MVLDAIEAYPGAELTPDLLEAVLREERFVPGPTAAPDVRVLTYRPKNVSGRLPLVVSMHGGAFALRADMFPAGDAHLATLGSLVVSVDYRSLPDHRYPCAVEDCYAALSWASQELDIDPTRIIVTGASAGGALAAATTLMARDRGGPGIALQALVIPVLDDRCRTASMAQFVEAPVFGSRRAREMWQGYLGSSSDSQQTPAYASPARATDLTGLPPAYIQVNGMDPLRDEGIEYAMRLMAAGVAVELYCAPYQHHGVSDDPRPARQAARLFEDAIRAAVAGDGDLAASSRPSTANRR